MLLIFVVSLLHYVNSDYTCNSYDDVCYERLLTNGTAFVFNGGGHLKCKTAVGVCNSTYLGINTSTEGQAIRCESDWSCMNGRIDFFHATFYSASLTCIGEKSCQNVYVYVGTIYKDRRINCNDPVEFVCKFMSIDVNNTLSGSVLTVQCSSLLSCSNVVINSFNNASIELNCEGSSSCENLIINSYGSANIDIFCDEENACFGLLLNINSEGTININCDRNFDDSCPDIIVNAFNGVVNINCDKNLERLCTGLQYTCINAICNLACFAGTSTCDNQVFNCNGGSICSVTNSNGGSSVLPINSSLSCEGGSICNCDTYVCITQQPTQTPSFNPTNNPSIPPTLQPTETPTIYPTRFPSLNPSENPSFNPTMHPSMNPTLMPTMNPSKYPTETNSPSFGPSVAPTKSPSMLPTQFPSILPTQFPSLVPSQNPTTEFLEGDNNNGNNNFATQNGAVNLVVILLVMLIATIAMALFYRYYQKKHTNQKNSASKHATTQSKSSNLMADIVTTGGEFELQRPTSSQNEQNNNEIFTSVNFTPKDDKNVSGNQNDESSEDDSQLYNDDNIQHKETIGKDESASNIEILYVKEENTPQTALPETLGGLTNTTIAKGVPKFQKEGEIGDGLMLPNNINEWTEENTLEWLKFEVSLEEYRILFSNNGINGETLNLWLNKTNKQLDEELELMGINKYAHRVKLRDAIAKLTN